MNELPTPPAIAVLAQDPSDSRAIADRLASQGMTCQIPASLETLDDCEALPTGCLVFVKPANGSWWIDALEERRRRSLKAPVVVAAADVDVRFAVAAMRRGAFSVVDLHCHADLLVAIREALDADAERRRRDASRDELRHALRTLTSGELEVISLIVAGAKNTVIARRLRISVRTVEVRRRSASKKLGAKSAAALIAAVWHALDGDLSRLPTPREQGSPEIEEPGD